MGARYYDPVLGRFMGIDPLDFREDNLHSFNRYAYANNNPYKYVDPDGKDALEISAMFTLAMAMLVSVFVTSLTGGGNKDGGDDGALGAGNPGSNIDSSSNWNSGTIFNQNSENDSGAEDKGTKARDDEAKESSRSGRSKDVPNRGEPGEVREGTRRTREYGADGKPIRDYDKPHQGYDRPHVHEWPGGVREHPGRDYSPLPRK